MFGTKRNDGFESLINRPRPSKLQKFLKEPCLYLARLLYEARKIRRVEPSNAIAIVCISDTHNAHLDLEIPEGEILVHAGDATQAGTLQELQAAIDWLDQFPHRHKVMIGGNHDVLLDRQRPGFDSKARESIDWKGITYLENESLALSCTGGRHLQIYGSPSTTRHGNWAFQHPRGYDAWKNTVPAGTDILITHGPPRSHLDLGHGCDFLLEELWRTRPKLHVFGHIHAGYGQEQLAFDDQQKLFESISKARGGLWRLLLLCYKNVMARFVPSPSPSTLLVNAAAVGGLRDDQRRPPVIVRI
jgi:predicted phosphohydrolase